MIRIIHGRNQLILVITAFFLLAGTTGLVLRKNSASADLLSTSTFVTPTDKIPNFAQNPNISCITSGSWDNPATWSIGRVPSATDVVLISKGCSVTIDAADAVAKVVGVNETASLIFDPNKNTKLKVGTLLGDANSLIQIGTQAAPIANSVTAEVVVADQAIDTTFDPRQFGTGLLSFGKVVMYGRAVQTTYVQLATEPLKGALTLSLSQPASDWQVGDQLILPDTRQYPIAQAADAYAPQLENLVISAVSTDGKTITLSAPLAFDHKGAHDGNGALVALPHVGDLSRNILIHSEKPSGGTRGHVFFTQYADVNIHFARFKDLGRTTDAPLDSTTFNTDGTVAHIGTNQIGRYAVHFHHVFGPQAGRGPGIANTQYLFEGNSIDSFMKWGLAIHDTSFGIVDNNILSSLVVGSAAGIVMENAQEISNNIYHNFVAGINGTGGDYRSRPQTIATENPTAETWFYGTCIGARSANNMIHDNVVADCSTQGIEEVPLMPDLVNIPKFAGANTGDPTQVEPFHFLYPDTYSHNTVYGATQFGILFWGSVRGPQRNLHAFDLTFRPTGDLVWNMTQRGFYGGDGSMPPELHDFTYYGDPSQITTTNSMGIESYWASFVNAHIENAAIGINTAQQYYGGAVNYGEQLIKGGYLRNRDVDLKLGGAHDNYANETLTVINGIQFAASTGYPLHAVLLRTADSIPGLQVETLRRVYMLNYNNQPGADFQLFWGAQNPTAGYPNRALLLSRSTEPQAITAVLDDTGLTNAQAWAKYGRTTFGQVATCTTQLPWLSGLTEGAPNFSPPPSIINEAYACPLQNMTLTGQVKNSQGQPVAGVHVDAYSHRDRVGQDSHGGGLAHTTGNAGPSGTGANVDVHNSLFPANSTLPLRDDIYQEFQATTVAPEVTATTDSNGNYSLTTRTTQGIDLALTFNKSGFTSQIVPVDNFSANQVVSATIDPGGTTVQVGDGLRAKYFTSASTASMYTDEQSLPAAQLSRVDPTVNFDWTKTLPLSDKAPGSVFWAGEVVPLVSGDYWFFSGPGEMQGYVLPTTTATRGNGWYTFPSTASGIFPSLYQTTGVTLQAGVHYKIVLQYNDNTVVLDPNRTDPSSIKVHLANLQWMSKDVPRQVIPQSQLFSGAVSAPADSQAPTTPTSLIAATSSAGVSLNWTVSTDNLAVVGYEVDRNGSKVGSVTGTNYTDSGLTSLSTYTYTVKAYDAAGNISPASNTVSVTTPDTIAPNVPTSLSVSAPTSSTTTLSWTASSDNLAVTGYKIYRGGTQVGTSVTSPYTDSGLAPSTAYTYFVKAYDAASNLSLPSNNVSVTTLAPTPTPTPATISFTKGPTISAKGGTTATITFTTSLPSTATLTYGRSSTTLTSSKSDTTSRTTHTITLSGLSKLTTYYYKVTVTGTSNAATTASSVLSLRTTNANY